MKGRSEKLDIYEFGRRLIRTKDLDPVYVLVYEAKLQDWMLERWLLAYWCFYHVGTACWCAEGDSGYWDRMMTAAGSKDYPRSSERRHFRADNAVSSVTYLRDRGLQSLFEAIKLRSTAEGVMAEVRTWRGFGPWIAFKIADMVERIGYHSVTFDVSTVLYDSPREAAELLWRMEHPGNGRRAPDKKEGEWALDRLVSRLAKPIKEKVHGVEKLGPNDWKHVDSFRKFLALYAPPRYDRPIGPQEAETILCKWGSYMNGHYEIGEDLRGCREGLLKFSRVRLAQDMLKAGKRGKLWE